MLGEEISTDGPIQIYCSQLISPHDCHGLVQLDVNIETQ